jgi:methionine-S-sulfoxide reductase
VIRTRVGYAGGSTPSPTYRDLGDHSETVEIDYDPSVISYDKLLDIFWKDHDPVRKSWSRQYASRIFVHDDEQRRSAERSLARIEWERGRSVSTKILPYTGFTLAENYHQKHSLGQFSAFEEELRMIYPSPADFVASTAVARVNGYLGGEGSYDALQEEVNSLGLSAELRKELLRIVPRRTVGQACPLPAKETVRSAP